MKITDVKTFPYDAAFRDVVFVQVETDEGIHGWGEATVQEPALLDRTGGECRVRAHRPGCRRDVSAHNLRHAVARLRQRRTARCSAAVSALLCSKGRRYVLP